MGRIRNTLGAITLSAALALGCNNFNEHNKEENEKAEKSTNRNSYLKGCEKRLDEYKKMASTYDDKDLLKSLEGEKWCSKERYDKHEDTREMFYVARKKSLSFCNYWFGEALKSSEKYNEPAGTLMLRRIGLNPKQICADDVKGNYDLGSAYRKYSITLTQKK